MLAMKKIIPILLILILTLPIDAVPRGSKPGSSINPVRILVIPFKNTSGDAALNWLSIALQDAIINNIFYLKGFEMGDVSSREMTKEESIKYAKERLFPIQRIWFGKYAGDANSVTVEISVLDVISGAVLITRKYEAPLNKLLNSTSQSVLEIAQGLGAAAKEDEEKRVLSRKTASVEAWRFGAEGIMHIRELGGEGQTEEGKKLLLEKAEKALNKAITADPEYAEVRVYLGELYGEMGKWEMAVEAFRSALALKPYLILANMGMGYSLLKMGDADGAVEYFKKGIHINPSQRAFNEAVYTLLKNNGKKEELRGMAMQQLKSVSSVARAQAAIALGDLGGRSEVPILISMLKDPDKEVLGSVLFILGQIGNRETVPYLVGILDSADKDIRVSAIYALRNIGDSSAVPALIAMLKDNNAAVRCSAAWALGAISDRSSNQALHGMLADVDKEARIIAAWALGRMDDKSGVPALVVLLKDADDHIRERAAWALHAAGDKSAVPALIEALKDKNHSVRTNAASALGKIGDKTAIPALIEALRGVEDFRIDDAIAKIGDKAAITVLTGMLKDSDKKMRERAANVLGALQDKTTVPALIEALNDTEIWVRVRAVLALDKIGDISAVPALRKMLEDPDGNVRGYAADALGKLGDKVSLSLLIEGLKDSSAWVRLCAAGALGRLGDRSAIPALLEVLKDKDDQVRRKAAESLAKMGDRSGIHVLIEALSDIEGWWRMEGARTLAALGEAKGLYDYFYKTFNLHVFNQIRKNLLFIDNFDNLTKSDDPFLKSSGYYLLALKSREEGRYKEQLENANNALKHIKQKNETAIAVLSLWLKAHAELKLEKSTDSSETIKKVEELLAYISKKEREDYEELFEEYTAFLKGEIAVAGGNSKTAMKAYEDALSMLERSKRNYQKKDAACKLEAMVRTSLGAFQIKMGKENLEKAVEGGRNYQASDSVEMENEEKRYMELARQKIAEGSYEESQKLLEELNLRRTNYINRRMKINLADAEKQGQINEFRKKQEEIESIGKRIEAFGKDKKGAGDPSQGEDEIKRLEKERNDKRRELQIYLTNLKKTHPDIAALMGARPLELTALQEQLPEDTAILQYLMLPDKLIVFVIRNKGIDIVETRVKRSELRDKVATLRKAIYAKVEGENSRMIKPLSRELYGVLIKPIEEGGKLKGVKVIGIAPNSFLHQLPFGVLMDPEAKHLIDRYSLFYMNSTSILGVAMERGKQKRSGENTLLAFSNPDGSLNYADIEVADISKLFGKKMIYSKKDARKSVIQSKEKDYSILHLSTHGIFDPIDSTKSHLVMSDSNLTVEEIWGLPLKGTTLTVLSACETGVGDVLSGDDVVSLENAFIYAGSPSVVATLWKVADQSTAELMGLFYQNLAKGKTKAEALTDAQRKLRENYDHPFFWAPFTLRGDWR
jgi:HEAT repeat protein/CHAT domain-containing protein/TolB-like protein